MTLDAATITALAAFIGLVAKIALDYRADRDRSRQVNADLDQRGDEQIIKLFTTLNQSEAQFRQAVYDALLAERNENRALSERLTVVTNQLSIITLERDGARHELEKVKEHNHTLQREVDQLRAEVARLRAQVGKQQLEADRNE